MPRKKKAVTKKAKKRAPKKTHGVRPGKSLRLYSPGKIEGRATAYTGSMKTPPFTIKTIRTQHGEGIKMSGRAYIGYCSKNGPVGYASAYTQAATATQGYGYVFPDYLFSATSRAFQTTKQYSRWAFRKMKLKYVPGCATTFGGIFSIGYYSDPCSILTSSATTFSQLQDNPTSVASQPWAYCETDLTPGLDQNFLGYTDIDAAGLVTDDSVRQQFQGVIVATWSAPPTEDPGVIVGIFELEFEIDLYQPAGSINIALDGKRKYPPFDLSKTLSVVPLSDGVVDDDLVLVKESKVKSVSKK